MKRKWNILVNIGLVCLCLCAIAVGVYSAKNASLTLTGQVGFVAHNCEMHITNFSVANSSREKGVTAVQKEFSDYLPNNSSTLSEFPQQGIEVSGTTPVSFNMGKFYFVDDVEQNKIPDIVITFTIKNKSSFPVTATISEYISTNEKTKDKIELVDFISTKGFAGKDQNNSTKNIVLKLRLKDCNIETLDIDNFNFFSISFSKDDNAQVRDQGEYYIENGRLYVEYGYYPTTDVDYTFKAIGTNSVKNTTIYGENLGKPIRWVAYSSSNTMLDFTNIQEIPTGTFYFVSEYVLTPGVKFNTTTNSPVNGKNPNDYASSEIREYIKNESFVNEYGLSTLVKNADVRTLPTETIEDGTNGTYEGDMNLIWRSGEFHSDYLQGYIIDNVATTCLGCDDSIWLLGASEYSYVSTVLGEVAYYPSQTDQIYSSTPTEYGVNWWTRSPYGGVENTSTSAISLTSAPIFGAPAYAEYGYENVRAVRNSGYLSNFNTVNSTNYGIRLGFQITISK